MATMNCQHALRSLKNISKKLKQLNKVLEIGVISNGGCGTSKSIIVSFDNQSQRLLFNCGEGTLRTFKAYEYSVPYLRKSQSIKDIFITQLTVQNVAGIQDFIRRQDNRYSNTIRLYGPGDMRNRSILGFKSANDPILEVIDVAEEEQYYESSYTQIQCIPLFPLLSDTHPNGHLRPRHGQHVDSGPHQKTLLSSIVYILKPKSDDAPKVILLDCPDKRYLESLLESEDLKKHQSDDRTVVFHLSPVSVVQNARYQTFINRFPESTKHLHLDETMDTKSLDHIRNRLRNLNKIDSTIFPLLPICGGTQLHESGISKTELIKRLPERDSRLTAVNCGHMEVFSKEEKRYLSGKNHTKKDKLEKFIKQKNVYLTEIKKRLQGRTKRKEEYPDILFLGTSRGSKTDRRNNSGIYIQLSPETAILLDCGTGTYTQMCLHFGSQTNEMLGKIKCVFISHLHLDHYAGLATVLKKRHDGFLGPAQKVAIISEPKIVQCLQTMAWGELDGVLKTTVLYEPKNWKSNQFNSLRKQLNLSELRPIKALHNVPAQSLSLRLSSGVHMVYSGDTRPNFKLITRGSCCDILIHEATFQSKRLAYQTSHSSVEDAIFVSENMRAKHTILTHFVDEELHSETRNLILSKPNVTVAVDLMRLRMSDLPYTPLLNPFLIHP